jgi:FkbM family methyltransferase
MKRLIQNTVGRFGYEVKRKSDAFAVQRLLLTKQAPMIFDVGANVGDVTRQYRGLFPSAVIHSFEPFPNSFKLLKQGTANDNNVFVHQLAISDKKARLALHSNAADVTNSLLPTDSRANTYWGEGMLETQHDVEVACTTIDFFCGEQGISEIDILKLDIQGAELLALTGAKTMLSKEAISLVYSEIITVPTYEGQAKLHEHLQFFDSLGYELFDIYNPTKKSMQLIEVDALFINRAVKKAWESR